MLRLGLGKGTESKIEEFLEVIFVIIICNLIELFEYQIQAPNWNFPSVLTVVEINK